MQTPTQTAKMPIHGLGRLHPHLGGHIGHVDYPHWMLASRLASRTSNLGCGQVRNVARLRARLSSSCWRLHCPVMLFDWLGSVPTWYRLCSELPLYFMDGVVAI